MPLKFDFSFRICNSACDAGIQDFIVGGLINDTSGKVMLWIFENPLTGGCIYQRKGCWLLVPRIGHVDEAGARFDKGQMFCNDGVLIFDNNGSASKSPCVRFFPDLQTLDASGAFCLPRADQPMDGFEFHLWALKRLPMHREGKKQRKQCSVKEELLQFFQRILLRF